VALPPGWRYLTARTLALHPQLHEALSEVWDLTRDLAQKTATLHAALDA
jgi:hypothetical protein